MHVVGLLILALLALTVRATSATSGHCHRCRCKGRCHLPDLSHNEQYTPIVRCLRPRFVFRKGKLKWRSKRQVLTKDRSGKLFWETEESASSCSSDTCLDCYGMKGWYRAGDQIGHFGDLPRRQQFPRRTHQLGRRTRKQWKKERAESKKDPDSDPDDTPPSDFRSEDASHASLNHDFSLYRQRDAKAGARRKTRHSTHKVEVALNYDADEESSH